MHMSADANKWLELNTSYCRRLSAWISVKACEACRASSAPDIARALWKEGVMPGAGTFCEGCNGLHDQVQFSATILNHSLQHALEELLDADGLPEEETAGKYAGHDASVIDEDILDEELLELLPEYKLLQQETEALPRTRRKPAISKRVRQFAVYTGSCRRCGGYMMRDIEEQFGERDEDAHRCFTCGWRTSPGYEFNRPSKVEQSGRTLTGKEGKNGQK